jgi:uncharacterized lipoprotein YehR (DUF1307 family)
MLFKLSDVFNITRSLPKLAEKELSIRVAYRLSKLLKECAEEMETLEKLRVKLVEKYAKKSEDNEEPNKEIKVADENIEKFQIEFASLLNEEVDIDFEPISMQDLGDIQMTTNDLLNLSKIIKEK